MDAKEDFVKGWKGENSDENICMFIKRVLFALLNYVFFLFYIYCMYGTFVILIKNKSSVSYYKYGVAYKDL